MLNQIKLKELVKVYFKYSNNSYSLLPLQINNKYMLCANEYDFMHDGYTIRRLEDIDEIQIDSKYQEIVKAEKIFEHIQTPNVKIDNWKDIFTSLYNFNENIIIETESLNNGTFYIGKIEKIMNNSLIFKTFDNNGVWDESSDTIKYIDITSVTFKSRYINVFSKYLK